MLPSLTSSRAAERRVEPLLDRPAEVAAAEGLAPAVELVAPEAPGDPAQETPEEAPAEAAPELTASQGLVAAAPTPPAGVRGPKLKVQKSSKVRAQDVAPKANRGERKKRTGVNDATAGGGRAARMERATGGQRAGLQGQRSTTSEHKRRKKRDR